MIGVLGRNSRRHSHQRRSNFFSKMKQAALEAKHKPSVPISAMRYRGRQKKSIFAQTANYCRKDWQENIVTLGLFIKNSSHGEPINSIYLATQSSTAISPNNENDKQQQEKTFWYSSFIIRQTWKQPLLEEAKLPPAIHRQKGEPTHLSLYFPCLLGDFWHIYIFLISILLISQQDNILAVGNIQRKRH